MSEQTVEIKLNIGCGMNKIPGYINIDANGDLNPDLTLDIRKGLPYQDNSVSEIVMYHTIEHIAKPFHRPLLEMLFRIIKLDGWLYLAYPEFEKIARNWLENTKSTREWWEATIYGRQLDDWDTHRAAMNSRELKITLESIGFVNVEYRPEPEPNEFNTVIRGQKGQTHPTYEDILRDTVWQPKAK